jgi:hypothetical protein
MSKAAPTPCLHAGLTQSILAAAIRVQDALGPGLLEKPYRLCLQCTEPGRLLGFNVPKPAQVAK